MNENSSPVGTTPPGDDGSSGFYTWLRRLGITRQPGWLGGVAAGVAHRLNIDPLIVRGILVVVGLLGAPVLLVYAAAWALLPDATGRIHLEEAMRGVFDRPIAGILVLLILAVLPFTGYGWWWDWFRGGDPWSGISVTSGIWAIILVGVGIWLVVWLATRPSTTSTGPTPTPYGAAPTGGSDPNAGSAPTAAFAVDASGAASSAAPGAPNASGPGEPVAPPAPPTGADDSELAAWRQGQAEWRREHDAWRARQASDAQAFHQQRAEEERRRRHEEAAARARENAERELRTRPGVAYSLVAVGLALLAGGVTWLTLYGGELSTRTITVAALSASLVVLALAIIINGIRGRRSGGSGGAAVVVIISLLFTGIGGMHMPVLSGELAWSPTSAESNTSRAVVSGDVEIDLAGYFVDDTRSGTVTLYIVSGDVDIVMPADARGRVDVNLVSGDVRHDRDRVGSGSFVNTITELEPRTGTSNRSVDVQVRMVSGDVTITQAER